MFARNEAQMTHRIVIRYVVNLLPSFWCNMNDHFGPANTIMFVSQVMFET